MQTFLCAECSDTATEVVPSPGGAETRSVRGSAFHWTRKCNRFGWLRLKAQVALDKKKPTPALNVLQAATPSSWDKFRSSSICPASIRCNCWTEALSHLGVARANALQSRTSQGADADAARVRALAAYKDFLTLWKDADPDIPILKESKAEYAKLQWPIRYAVTGTGMHSRNLKVCPRGSQIDSLATFRTDHATEFWLVPKRRADMEILAATPRRILLSSVYLATTQWQWPAALSNLSHLWNCV